MTLQDYTDKLQELCHSGLAQKKVVLYCTIKGEIFMKTMLKKHLTSIENGFSRTPIVLQ